jgi:hypothetical protein
MRFYAGEIDFFENGWCVGVGWFLKLGGVVFAKLALPQLYKNENIGIFKLRIRCGLG